MTKPKAVIFDFDGVIANSLGVHIRAWELASTELFGRTYPHGQELAGMATEAIGRKIAQFMGDPHKGPILAEAKRKLLQEQKVTVPLLPGVEAAFIHLSHLGIPYGIASNAPRLFIEQTLHQHGIIVPIYVGIEDSGRPKPYPDPFLLCAKRLGVPFTRHEHTYVFEDSTHGLAAAVAAKMIPIGVTTQHDGATLKGAGARLTCPDVAVAMAHGWFEEIPEQALKI